GHGYQYFFTCCHYYFSFAAASVKGNRIVTVVPLPGSLCISNSAPISLALLNILFNPTPAVDEAEFFFACTSKPMPSSAICILKSWSEYCKDTFTLLAFAC